MSASVRRKLIIVSNRGPVSFGRDPDGTRTQKRGAGGLVTSLRGLIAHHDVTWIASAFTQDDRALAGAARAETLAGAPYRLRLVAHDEQAFDRFYNVAANPALWFLQHNLWELVEGTDAAAAFPDAWDAGYVPVNEAFADAVVAEVDAAPDSAVLLHDYHLYVAPRLIRERLPDARLSHFVHIPWPEPDAWRVLPERIRSAIHDGLLANDVVGLHTRRWQENFLACADEFCGGAREAVVVAHPISVDADEFEGLAQSEEVLAEQRKLQAWRSERMVLRVDRTDPTKNIVRGFHAFERYLELHPDAHGRVAMCALLDPSRQDIPQYAAYAREIETVVDEVNARFASEGWTPIRLELEDNFHRSVAAYKEYDVLLVNAFFDGLNLVAKEAPLVNERDGVLVLSKNAGVYEELGEWAVAVDPLDVEQQAEALAEALALPPEARARRAAAIRAHVREHDLGAWLDAQLADLDRIGTRAPR